MKNHKQQVQKELKEVGANLTELDELLSIASKLSLLRVRKSRNVLLDPFRFAKPLGYAASSLAIGLFIVILSQSALPNSWLYPVQNVSDAVAIDFYPQYRATVMMKHAQQVNELVASHARSKLVFATLADYTSEAGIYKATPHTNYAAFAYCKSNLQKAESDASPPERQAISNSLQSLETT